MIGNTHRTQTSCCVETTLARGAVVVIGRINVMLKIAMSIWKWLG